MTELCEVVITAPDPEWLISLTRELASRRTMRRCSQLRARALGLPMARPSA